MASPRISLVVCTYNRADILPRCLEAAVRQSLPVSDYEVIVVDNGSTDHTRAIVERIAARNSRVRYILQHTRGLSHARNTGALAARAPVVAYIDDDSIAHPELLERLLSVFDSMPRCGCAGGRIQLRVPERLPWWYSGAMAGYFSDFDPGFREVARLPTVDAYPFGANIAFRKKALEQVGLFSVRLGRVGKDYSGGEEIDAACKIAAAGYEIYYQPGAVVEHVVDPDRIRWEHIRKSAAAAGRNWAYYECELLRTDGGLRPDVLALLATVKQIALALAARRLKCAVHRYSIHLFLRSKIRRKIRYRLQAFQVAENANRD